MASSLTDNTTTSLSSLTMASANSLRSGLYSSNGLVPASPLRTNTTRTTSLSNLTMTSANSLRSELYSSNGLSRVPSSSMLRVTDPSCINLVANSAAPDLCEWRSIKASRSFTKMTKLSSEDLQKLAKRSSSKELLLLFKKTSMQSRDKSLSSMVSLSAARSKQNLSKANDVFHSSAPTSSSTTPEGSYSTQSPISFLLDQINSTSSETIRTVPHLNLDGLFQPVTPDQRKAYDKEAVTAVHKQDMALLRTWHEQGRTLQAANAFGESLLHLACRRGYLELVAFLVEEVKVNLWIRDDTGRSPLHYACWTSTPSFALIDFIIKQDRDLLYVTDKRGHTPLDYTRKEHWEQWISHFRSKNMMEELLPNRTDFYVKEE